MPKVSNLEVYENLSKEQLMELATLYGRLALSLDGFWFLEAEKALGLEKAIKMDEEVWRQIGRTEGRALKKYLSIDKVTTLEDICKIYLLTPIFGNLGARAEVVDQNCILSVTYCHPQVARVKKNLGEFPCKPVGIAYFEGLLKEMNPNIRFSCRVCPPDKHPDDLWCEWEVWIENG